MLSDLQIEDGFVATIEILGINTTAQRFAEAVNTLMDWARENTPHYVCTCPVYTLMMGVEQPTVRQALNSASMVTADGMPVVWMQRKLGDPGAERVYGPDLMTALCSAGVGCGLRHFFFGGTAGVANQVAEHVQHRFPGLVVAGTYAPPYAPVGNSPNQEFVTMLNESRAHVIWVGLGSPKQDIWMMRYRPVLDAPLLIGVGAAFDFVAGTKRQAPSWMRRSGFEWVFRLTQEPRRLWKRYLIYNFRFLWQIWRHYLS